MSANETLLQKADWAIGDLTANSGLLNPEQANAFIRKLLIQPTLLAQARRVVMNAPTRKINKIQFASRILKAGYTAGLSRDLDDTANRERSKPTTEQIELNTKEVIAEVRLPYAVLSLRGRFLRQGHARHDSAAPVRQGRAGAGRAAR